MYLIIENAVELICLVLCEGLLFAYKSTALSGHLICCLRFIDQVLNIL